MGCKKSILRNKYFYVIPRLGGKYVKHFLDQCNTVFDCIHIRQYFKHHLNFYIKYPSNFSQ